MVASERILFYNEFVPDSRRGGFYIRPCSFADGTALRAHIECAPTVRRIRKAGIMKNTKTKRMLAVAALLAVGLLLRWFGMKG